MSRTRELSTPTARSVQQQTRSNAERIKEEVRDVIRDLLSANEDLEGQLENAISIIEELESELAAAKSDADHYSRMLP